MSYISLLNSVGNGKVKLAYGGVRVSVRIVLYDYENAGVAGHGRPR